MRFAPRVPERCECFRCQLPWSVSIVIMAFFRVTYLFFFLSLQVSLLVVSGFIFSIGRICSLYYANYRLYFFFWRSFRFGMFPRTPYLLPRPLSKNKLTFCQIYLFFLIQSFLTCFFRLTFCCMYFLFDNGRTFYLPVTCLFLQCPYGT